MSQSHQNELTTELLKLKNDQLYAKLKQATLITNLMDFLAKGIIDKYNTIGGAQLAALIMDITGKCIDKMFHANSQEAYLIEEKRFLNLLKLIENKIEIQASPNERQRQQTNFERALLNYIYKTVAASNVVEAQNILDKISAKEKEESNKINEINYNKEEKKPEFKISKMPYYQDTLEPSIASLAVHAMIIEQKQDKNPENESSIELTEAKKPVLRNVGEKLQEIFLRVALDNARAGGENFKTFAFATLKKLNDSKDIAYNLGWNVLGGVLTGAGIVGSTAIPGSAVLVYTVIDTSNLIVEFFSRRADQNLEKLDETANLLKQGYKLKLHEPQGPIEVNEIYLYEKNGEFEYAFLNNEKEEQRVPVRGDINQAFRQQFKDVKKQFDAIDKHAHTGAKELGIAIAGLAGAAVSLFGLDLPMAVLGEGCSIGATKEILDSARSKKESLQTLEGIVDKQIEKDSEMIKHIELGHEIRSEEVANLYLPQKKITSNPVFEVNEQENSNLLDDFFESENPEKDELVIEEINPGNIEDMKVKEQSPSRSKEEIVHQSEIMSRYKNKLEQGRQRQKQNSKAKLSKERPIQAEEEEKQDSLTNIKNG